MLKVIYSLVWGNIKRFLMLYHNTPKLFIDIIVKNNPFQTLFPNYMIKCKKGKSCKKFVLFTAFSHTYYKTQSTWQLYGLYKCLFNNVILVQFK